MTLQERLKTLRQKSGLSQEKVAEQVGVSRQAVTKWESGKSAPSTENLFRLAEIYGTTVDFLLTEEAQGSTAEQVLQLHKMEETQKSKQRLSHRKQNLLLALAVVGGYGVIYLLGRIFGSTGENASVMGWLLGDDPAQLSYLYGWLLHQRLFWIAMAISALPALWGKKYFSVTTLFGFGVGLLLGELCGVNPAGAAYGQGHYGWAIWGCIFAESIVAGVILEKMMKGNPNLRKIVILAAVYGICILLIVLGVRTGMPA